jgi:hypothetical protein
MSYKLSRFIVSNPIVLILKRKSSFLFHEVNHHKRLLRLSGLSDRDRGTVPSSSPATNKQANPGKLSKNLSFYCPRIEGS